MAVNAAPSYSECNFTEVRKKDLRPYRPTALLDNREISRRVRERSQHLQGSFSTASRSGFVPPV